VAELIPATGRLLQQILEETFPIWGEGLTFRNYEKFWAAQLQTPWGRLHLDRVALVEEGGVTSSAKRYELSARIDGRIRRVLGIGAVFTSPSRRGRGGARRLVEAMLERGEAEGFEYAMLFSEINPAYYEQFDFVAVPHLESALMIARRDGSPAMLVRTGDDRDIPAMAEMSARIAAAARFALDRSEDWIRFSLSKRRLLSGLGPSGVREVEFVVAEEGHQAVAYVIATVHEGRWFVEEAGDRDPSAARVGAILQTMLARTPHLETPEIRAWLPHGFRPPQVTISHTQPASEVMMVRPLAERTLPLPPLAAQEVVYWHNDYF
jgi:predicted N-acetyltransferase YhbS